MEKAFCQLLLPEKNISAVTKHNLMKPKPTENDIKKFISKFNSLLSELSEKESERFHEVEDNVPQFFISEIDSIVNIRININGMGKLPPKTLDKVIAMINKFEGGYFE